MALLVTARFDTADEPVMVQTDPLVRLTAVVEVESVWIAPVRVDAFAFSVIMLPLVASRRLLSPALAVVLLKLMVATDGSAKIRLPVWFAMPKLSKVATWFVPPRKSIASPAEAIVPPPVARMEAPLPCSATAAAAALFVWILRVPVAVIEPAVPLEDASLANSPVAPAPDVVMVAAASAMCEPAPSALTPKAPRPVAGETPPVVVIVTGPVAVTPPPSVA